MAVWNRLTNDRARAAFGSLLLLLLGGCGGGGASNSAPVATGTSASGLEDTAIPIVLFGSDADGDAVEYRVVTPPLRGSLSQSGTGPEVTYTPGADFSGADQFAFQVVDTRGAHSAQAIVRLEVLPQNDAPRAVAKAASSEEGAADLVVQEDSVASFAIAVSDPEGDSFTFAVSVSTEHGVLQSDASGSLTYAPDPDYHGPDRFSFVLSDAGGAQSSVYRYKLQVAEVNDTPTAADAQLVIDEDEPAQIMLSARDVDGDPLVYQLLDASSLGNAAIDASGRLTYAPAADRNGSEQLRFAVRDSRDASSAPATIDIEVHAVDDAPRITLPAHATNSAYTEDTVVEYAVTEVDGEAVTANVTVDDTSVATVSNDGARRRLTVHPVRRGATEIVLAASDGHSTVQKTLSFEVTDVTKQVQLQLADPTAQAVHIVNSGEEPVSFTLSSNGFTSFESLDAVVEHVRDIPEDYAGEPFERKLWRFLIANVVHEYPLTENLWLLDPLVTVNSFGWGLCSNVSNAYVRVARAAGLEARVWGLGGHVVSEVRSDGRWSVIDPDLSVFYRTADQHIAGIAELQAQPSLITNPIDPLYPIVDPGPYGTFVASIYASQADNETDARWDGPAEPLSGRVILPAGAQLTYPGQWDDAPLGYNGGDVRPVQYFRHARLQLPPGWTGTVRLPWMLRTVVGTARVRVGGVEYESTDPLLATRLRQPGRFFEEIDIVRADSDVGLVFYVNVAGFAVTSSNDIAVTGEKVWALEVGSTTLAPQNRRGTPLPASAMKNTPPARP